MNGCSRGSPPYRPRGQSSDARNSRTYCARRRRRWTCRGGGVARRAPERARRADPRGAWGETPRVCARKERRRGVRRDASVGRIVARVGSSGHPRGIPSLSGKGEGAIGARPWMGTRHASRRTKAPRSARAPTRRRRRRRRVSARGWTTHARTRFRGVGHRECVSPRPAEESPAGAGSRMAPPARRARRVGIDARADARARGTVREVGPTRRSTRRVAIDKRNLQPSASGRSIW